MRFTRVYPITDPPGQVVVEEICTGALVMTAPLLDGSTVRVSHSPQSAGRMLQIAAAQFAALTEWHAHLKQRAIVDGN